MYVLSVSLDRQRRFTINRLLTGQGSLLSPPPVTAKRAVQNDAIDFNTTFRVSLSDCLGIIFTIVRHFEP